ncbi:hypothetical protein [Caldanaerobacter subterraneus]|nr:hypothetical protein [Caldanaerobacter subterraneus]
MGILVRYKEGNDKIGYWNMFYSFIKTPVIIATFSGMFLQKIGCVGVFERNIILSAFMETVKLLSLLTIPMISLIIGYEIKFKRENLKVAILTVLLRNLLLVLLGLIINNFIFMKISHLDRLFQVALMTMFILPPPFIIPLYMKDDDNENKWFVSNVLAINTVSAIVLYVFIVSAYIRV